MRPVRWWCAVSAAALLLAAAARAGALPPEARLDARDAVEAEAALDQVVDSIRERLMRELGITNNKPVLVSTAGRPARSAQTPPVALCPPRSLSLSQIRATQLRFIAGHLVYPYHFICLKTNNGFGSTGFAVFKMTNSESNVKKQRKEKRESQTLGSE